MTEKLPHLVVRTEDAYPSGAHTDGTDAHTHGEGDDANRLLRANTIDFAQREKDEMRDLTQASEIVSMVDPESEIDPLALAGSNTASHWEPSVGQIFLGNSNDVPLPPDRRIRMRTLRNEEEDEDAFDWRTNDPGQGYGYDICIECHDYAPFPTSAHLRAAEEHLRVLEKRWIERCVADMDGVDSKASVPLRPPPSASHVVHLPFPSSPASSVVTVNTLLPFIAFLERLMLPLGRSPLTYEIATEQLAPPRAQNSYDMHSRRNTSAGFTPSSLPPPSSFPTSFFPSSPSTPSSAYTREPQGGADFYAAPLDLRAARNVSLAYSVFFPADFDWVQAGKLPGMYGGHEGCSGGDDALECFSTRLMWRENGQGELYLYAPKDKQTAALCETPPLSVCDADYGLSIGRGAFVFTPGDWTHVRQTVTLNTPGQQDGAFALDVNGVRVIERSDVYYRGAPAAPESVHAEGRSRARRELEIRP
ncbi:hypothetical protein NUW54_g7336 [Trametes sanguinea]|uniref:Uncharacterized protein n=1 Tax=Trametes sanguinea TaxID=158606 RepID=A0ACC1PLE5_9APHY|nr:hypothetical protein NUW54_g7336 [Trametes sanguinea]